MLIDQEARNVFASEITNGIIKSTIGFTHYSIRDNIINLQQKTALCLRCVAIKMQDHVIQCQQTQHLQLQFINDLKLALTKADVFNEDEVVLQKMIDDINNYLNRNNTYQTNQMIVGFDNLFRRLVVKQWKNELKPEIYYY